MPLQKGSSRSTVSRNISEMVGAGHPQAQAVAASLRQARKSKRTSRKGGGNMDNSTRFRGRKGRKHSKHMRKGAR